MTKGKPLLLCILIMVMLFSTSYPAHAHQTNAPILIPEIPETIFAAGDIAKCDGDDPWSEEFLELVGLLPESAGEERERNEPFLKELLEILHLREETDHYAKAILLPLMRQKNSEFFFKQTRLAC